MPFNEQVPISFNIHEKPDADFEKTANISNEEIEKYEENLEAQHHDADELIKQQKERELVELEAKLTKEQKDAEDLALSEKKHEEWLENQEEITRTNQRW